VENSFLYPFSYWQYEKTIINSNLKKFMTNQTIISSGRQYYFHTQHSNVRASQRGISSEDIIFVIQNENIGTISLRNCA
jgi:hypothetical protein